MNTKKLSTHLIAAAIALSIGSATSGYAANALISDDFTGVAASEMPLSSGLNAANLYFVGQVGGTPWSTGEDSVSPLSGMVLENQGSSSCWQYAVKQFSATTLSKTGDSIKVKLDYHVKSSTEDGHLDVALLNCPGRIESNSFTEQKDNPLLNAKGYSAYQLCKTTSTSNSFVKIKDGAADFESPKTLLTNNDSPSVLGDAGKAHTLVLLLTKAESGIEITWSIDGAATGSASDVDSPFDTFNTLRLMAPSDTQTRLDNISVTTNISKSESPLKNQQQPASAKRQ
jgi:hypothetical protein